MRKVDDLSLSQGAPRNALLSQGRLRSALLSLMLCLYAPLPSSLSLSPTEAAAQPTETPDESTLEEESEPEESLISQEDLDQAELLFFRGLTAYQSRDYSAAAISFQAAYLLVPNRALLYNIARSREQLQDQQAAISWYQSYLNSNPADETAIIHRIRQLGGEVIDPEENASAATQEEGPLEPVLVTEGPSVLPWIALSVGVGSFALASWFQGDALESGAVARASEDRSRWESAKGDAESAQLYADLSFGVGALSLLSAFYLWWDEEQRSQTRQRVASPPEGTSTSQSSWGLSPLRAGAQVGYQLRF